MTRNLIRNTWQKNVLYYDYRALVIQDFHLTAEGNLIRKDYQYRFNGELLKTRITKYKGTSSTIVSTKIISNDYGHQSRKIKSKYSSNGAERTLANYNYDAISRLVGKDFSPSNAITSFQTGFWDVNSTWKNSTIPTINDNVIINTGQTVTIPLGVSVSAGSLTPKRNFTK